MRPHPLVERPEVAFEALSARVTVAYGPVTGERWQANATIVVGDRATAVVDAMMTPAQTAPVRVAAERMAGGRPVRWVLLTHADPDHVLGRATFDRAEVVGSERSRDVLRDSTVRERYAGIAARLGDGPEPFDMPRVDVAFGERATVDLGGMVLEAVSVGPAHSPADTLWWLEDERIAWSGDLVFHGAFPLVRTDLDRWLAGLDRLAAWRPAVVVAGHGPVGGPEVLDDQRRLLEALGSEVDALLRAGATVDEAVARVRLDAYRGLPMARDRIADAVRGAAVALGYGAARVQAPHAAMADPLERIRRTCLALPEVSERLSHGRPAWFVRGRRQIASFHRGHHDDPRTTIWCAAPPGAQDAFVATDPERFFRPPYVGHRGWLGVVLDGLVDWDDVDRILEDAYREIAPRARLADRSEASGDAGVRSDTRAAGDPAT